MYIHTYVYMYGCIHTHFNDLAMRKYMISTGNYIQYLVITYNGKESEKEYIYIYIYIF